MTPQDFVAKWNASRLKESAAYTEHFIDLCRLAGQPTPAEADPSGDFFTFQKGVKKNASGAPALEDSPIGPLPLKPGAAQGYADVWFKDHFAWEYKGRHKDLEKAREQLLQYLDDLQNPPVLVVCDFERFEIHTRFNNCVKTSFRFTNDDIVKPEVLAQLRNLFENIDAFKPSKTVQSVTEDVARQFATLAASLHSRGADPRRAAHFLMKLLFCLFAEDVGLLPNQIFTKIVGRALGRFQGVDILWGDTPGELPRIQAKTLNQRARDRERDSDSEDGFLSRHLRQLFRAMKTGGAVMMEEIDHFNGGLFDDDETFEMTGADLEALHYCCKQDWSSIEPSIFGTLFERSLDPAQRSQLGAHYTSAADIAALVEPVLMQPLRREWEAVRQKAAALRKKRNESGGAEHKRHDKALLRVLKDFAHRLSLVSVLDPSCGSGNFLYVSLNLLKDLEKEVVTLAAKCGHSLFRFVGPEQLYGIELNPYAAELARLVVWIGHIQWDKSHGLYRPSQPILTPLKNIKQMDAILDLRSGVPAEPKWPECDAIVGNPPFLGGKKLRKELGGEYLSALFSLWEGRVPREADLCCYWFEKALKHIKAKKCGRAGLLATQGIRGGASREALKHIKASGDIFFAISDREWILKGANVHISMVGFDNGSETTKQLDGKTVKNINANLTGGAEDMTAARRLPENAGIGFMGTTKVGPFDVADKQALEWLHDPNVSGRPNSDVLQPWMNGMDVTRRPSGKWIIYFGRNTDQNTCAKYQSPFEYLNKTVKARRDEKKKSWYRDAWWELYAPRPELYAAVNGRLRYLATPRVSKYRLFVWLDRFVVPDCQLIVFARADDYFFGVLHSRLHEVWARAQGTQVRERESGFRYTPTSCFETFPLPTPAPKQEKAVADAAKELDALRCAWLNPPEWTKEEVLTFPGSADGPWARHVRKPNAKGIGTAHYPRLLPADAECAKKLARRTLTNLYNERPAWLDLAHKRLDEAVAAAYGFPAGLRDDEILSRLLKLNLERPTTESDS
jgi:hypothetical protein